MKQRVYADGRSETEVLGGVAENDMIVQTRLFDQMGSGLTRIRSIRKTASVGLRYFSVRDGKLAAFYNI